MPARPAMLDHINGKMKGATIKEIVKPVCCFKDVRARTEPCKEKFEAFAVLRFADGKTDMYGHCKFHGRLLKSQHPTALATAKDQGAFFYS